LTTPFSLKLFEECRDFYTTALPKSVFFFAKHNINVDDHKYVYTLTHMNAHMHTLPGTSKRLVHKLDPTGFEINEVTTNTSLSTGTSTPNKEYS
jgi:hypothetical protein